MEKFFTPYTLHDFCLNLLINTGVSQKDADIIANVLIDTSLEGIDTHGISRLPVYLRCLKKKRINPVPDMKIEKTAPSIAVMDADNAPGQLAGVRAMEKAIELAKQVGTGTVPVRNSNHFGAASYYCKMATWENMIGMALTNTPAAIAPWGGKKPYLGTNPISFGFPTENTPVIVDMSSSSVARGNIINAAQEGHAIPDNWAMDPEGNPTTDPKEALEGSVLPLGGAKGYALALAVEMFCGILTGAAYGPHVGWIYDDKNEPVNIGHYFMAIDVNSIMPAGEFISHASQMNNEIKKEPLAKGYDQIYIPGERKHEKARQRKQKGIPVNPKLLEQLNEMAVSLGVNPLDNKEGPSD